MCDVLVDFDDIFFKVWYLTYCMAYSIRTWIMSIGLDYFLTQEVFLIFPLPWDGRLGHTDEYIESSER